MKKNYPGFFYALLLSYCNAFTQIPTDSLVAYYPFNGNANDTSGNGFNGSLNGQVSVAGQCGKAYKFSGNFIDCGDPAGNQFDLVNDATISLWMKLYSFPSSAPTSGNAGYFTLIGKDVAPGDNHKWFLATYSGQLVLHINIPGSGGFWVIQSIFSFVLNTFYHIVLTKASNIYRFYVNAVYYGAQILAENISDVPSSLRIGDLQDGSHPLNAAIDEVRIYHKELTQAEINQLYLHCSSGMVTSSGMIVQNQPADFKIYPNPSSDRFVLSFADLRMDVKNVSVFNVLGEKVFEQEFRLYNRDVIIDLGNKPKGVYLLQVQTRKKIMVSKIAVQ